MLEITGLASKGFCSLPDLNSNQATANFKSGQGSKQASTVPIETGLRQATYWNGFGRIN
jgi:hypothetical protein